MVMIGLIHTYNLNSAPKYECLVQKEVGEIQILPKNAQKQVEVPLQQDKKIPRVRVSDLAIDQSVIIEESSFLSSDSKSGSDDAKA